ncbi:sensor histidine kinase [Ralstonia sp. NFACC01]|uniref:sensor histidine kinase n=1 Tax=Ralstonia sp. NFACC01 TaxID=1566294 RepID=UPI0008F1ADB4|nr:ATP-binding protein [Ralstonia sp. NFACC01]SFP97726.1 Histidine kinase-, DNA gyrase B-, and HSP90-like ATPase [Ralstonia sp. NFACC01]
MAKSLPFRVQSHVLKLLGDELIGHDRLAVFELVKNAYDADATVVDVTLALDAVPPKITVRDNGSGMSLDTIEHAWLEIGTDSKRSKSARSRTALGRLPLGEKGVGRLAVQKLGGVLTLTTRESEQAESALSIDWAKLIDSARYLGDGMEVNVRENIPPEVFKDGAGTQVEITHLHRPQWSRREVRELYRLVSSLSNPFDADESFVVNLHLPGREDEVRGLPTLQEMLNSAVWSFSFSLDAEGKFIWKYDFTPPKFKGLQPRGTHATEKEKLQLLEPDEDDLPVEIGQSRQKRDGNIFLQATDLIGIGPITGKFYAFHRRDEILKASGASQQLKKWLDNQTGVRVYRDNIRVFNYGEPGEDWLGLDARRINRPAGKLGTQSVIAQVALSLADSYALKEKTNREGFDDNEAFRMLRRVVLSIFDRFQREHAPDRAEIDKALKGEDAPPPAIDDALSKLESLGKQHKLETEVKPILQSIQQELKTFREVMVSSGLAGMNLALIFHEVVHTIDRVQRRLQGAPNPDDIRKEIDHLRKLLDTFKPLLQRDPPRKVSAEDLVDRAAGMHEDRFERHGIVFSNWAADAKKKHSFTQMLPRGLMVAALSNVIDNAIYWTRFRRERDERDVPGAILALSHWDEEDGGMIAVVDNGPGFQLPPDQVGRPFFSTRAGGMGLGLFYCKTVMDSIGGKMDIVEASSLRDIVDFPPAYDGTAVIFTFKNEK